jgi:hypothetical protein
MKPFVKIEKHVDVVQELRKICDHDPVAFAVMIAKNPDVEWSVRERANRCLLDRIVPVLKAVEHSVSKETMEDMASLKLEMNELNVKYKANY